MDNRQTAMQQLLNQLKEERHNLPMDIEWDRCYQAIEMLIQTTYLSMEKGQIVDAIDYCREKYIDSENYYNETFKSEEDESK
jgi:hypothetical protein